MFCKNVVLDFSQCSFGSFFSTDVEIGCDITKCEHGTLDKDSCSCTCDEYWSGHTCGRYFIINICLIITLKQVTC